MGRQQQLLLYGLACFQLIQERFCPHYDKILFWISSVIVLIVHSKRYVLVPVYGSILWHLLLSEVTQQHYYGWRIIGLLVSCLLNYFFHVPELPPLSGTASVGCVLETIAGIETRIFYPVHKTHQVAFKPSSYLYFDHHFSYGMAIFSEMPHFIFRHIRHTVLEALDGAPMMDPISKAGWPVVLFSHGIGGTLEMYSNIVQEIASHGFIVLAMNHNDGSASVTRTNDEIRYYQPFSKDILSDDEKYFQVRNVQIRQRVEELLAVRDWIEKWGKVDLNNVFVAGHSFGGGTALQSAWTRPNDFKAVLLLDGWMFPAEKVLVAEGLGNTMPVFHLISTEGSETKYMQQTVSVAKGCTHSKSELLLLKESAHSTFSDAPLYYPRWMSEFWQISGPADPFEALIITREAMLNFLKDQLEATHPQHIKKKPWHTHVLSLSRQAPSH